MNYYDDKEIEVMTDDELKQFLSIANRMLEKAKANQTRGKIALDQVQKLYEEIKADLDDEDWGRDSEVSDHYSYADLKVAQSKVHRLEFKLKELWHEIIYLQRTIGRAKVELGSRESIKVGMPSFRSRVESELDDMFGEV